MTHHAYQPDWMFECDRCGLRVPALERYRYSGHEGIAEIRHMLGALGWIHEPITGQDWCPSCIGGGVA